MEKKEILEELLEFGLKSQKEVSHNYPTAHYLARICFGIFGMTDSLKRLHLGELKGFFDYNLYYTLIFSFEIIEEHLLSNSDIKIKIKDLNKKFHEADDLLNFRYVFGEHLEDRNHTKRITSDAIDSLTTVYYEALEILQKELKKNPIALTELYKPTVKEKDLMALFLKSISSRV